MMTPDEADRLSRLEIQMEYLLRHLGLRDPAAIPGGLPGLSQAGASGLPGPAGSVPPEVIALIQAGKKIQAIKAYRTATGIGLKEAKDAIDTIDRSYGFGRGRRR